MFDDVGGGFVEGEMTIPSAKTAKLGQPEFNTIDEPIRDTIVSYIALFFNLFSVSYFSCEMSRLWGSNLHMF